MARIPHPTLFRWSDVEAASDFERLKPVFEALPDERFMRFLEKRRGHGRNDYPIRPMWNLLIAGLVYRHPSMASLLDEARLNLGLPDACGFDPLLGADAAPGDDAFGRFVAVVARPRDWLLEMFDEVVQTLARHRPDLGKRLALDSKTIASFGSPVRDERKEKQRDGRRDLDASFGKKTYAGVREDGS